MKLRTGREINPRTALIFNGGVSTLAGSFLPHKRGQQDIEAEYLFGAGNAVPTHVTAASIRKHLISKDPDIEVIMHSWAPELEQELRREFAPVTAAFESNPGSEYFKNDSWPGCKDVQGGCPWIAVSWAYSMKRSIELMRQREAETGVQFSNVVFLPPRRSIVQRHYYLRYSDGPSYRLYYYMGGFTLWGFPPYHG
jgi:hypothetical protein